MNKDVMKQFDAIKKFRAMAKKKHYKKSKLDKHQNIILSAYQDGKSLEDIKVWLRDRRIFAERSTILRRIRFWEKKNGKI